MINFNFSNVFKIGILSGAFPTLQSPIIPPKKKLVPAFFLFLVMAFLDWSDLIDVIKFISIVVMIHMACDYQHQHDFLNLVMSAVIFLLLVGGGLFFYFLVMAFLDWND